jgi:hypothetical protein
MKTFVSILIVVGLCAVIGCAKKQEVDTVKLQASFSTAEPSKKSEVDKAVASINSQDWAGAMASLQRVATDAKLTEEQKQAVKDAMDQIGKVIKDTANKAVDGGKKAVEEAQKSLGK